MARRPRLFAGGLLYHVIVRGNQRRRTFLSGRDYQAYLERLAKYRRRYDYTVNAYCLMPNHVHLLVESSAQPLAKIMQGLQQSYSQYFNRRHRKVGHVFQGRYKAIICEKDEYLLELIRYIHLNPVRAGIVARPEQYRYSGHAVYLEGKPTQALDPTKILKLLGGKAAYKRFVRDGLAQGHKGEYYKVEDQRFLGPEGFEKEIRQKLGKTQETARRKAIGAVIGDVAKELGTGVEVLRSPDRSWAISKARTMVAYVMVRRLGYRLAEVAAFLGRDIATLGTLVSRLSERMNADGQLLRQVERLHKIVET